MIRIIPIMLTPILAGKQQQHFSMGPHIYNVTSTNQPVRNHLANINHMLTFTAILKDE